MRSRYAPPSAYAFCFAIWFYYLQCYLSFYDIFYAISSHYLLCLRPTPSAYTFYPYYLPMLRKAKR
eukprot:1855037-Rhodomonas_salina.1